MKTETFFEPVPGDINMDYRVKFISKLTISNFDEIKDVGEYDCRFFVGKLPLQSTQLKINKVIGKIISIAVHRILEIEFRRIDLQAEKLFSIYEKNHMILRSTT